jgi:hypothetical protein
LVYSGVFLLMPVHERKRGDPLKPAMAAQFFSQQQRKSPSGLRIAFVILEGN